MRIHKWTIPFPQTPVGYQMTSHFSYPKQLRFFISLLPLLVLLGIFELALWGTLQWEVVLGEKMAGRKKIQKDDEDILAHAAGSWHVNEFTKRGIIWTTRLKASEIYTISTTARGDFNTAVESVITLLDAKAHLIDIKLATEHERPLLSLFPSNGTHEILDHSDEVRKRIAQSSSCEVKVLMGSGFMDLIPALVTVQLQRRSVDQMHMEIQGISKESLIRYHAGKKAVHSVVQWIEEQL